MERLSFEKTKKLLKKYGIPYVKNFLVDSKKEGLNKAENLGWPIVLKTASPEVLHRTEKGGVVVDIRNRQDFEKGWKSVSALGGKVIVQKHIEGTEIIMGMKRDEQFGPVIMFGLGGIFTEVLKDVSFRVAPINRKEAGRMMREIKSFKVLQGFREKEEVKIEELVDILVNLSRFSLEQEEVEEIDFNPVIANSKKALVVDAKILTK